MAFDRSSSLEIRLVREGFRFDDLDAEQWNAAPDVLVDKYWSGEAAPPERHFSAKLLWSEKALYVRFAARQHEPMVVGERADLETKTMGLWDRDVCEVFIAPDRVEPRRYFEFEIAPNGEWVDLALDLSAGERKTDSVYSSGMRSAARIGNESVVMAIRVEWHAFGKMPNAGDAWLGNLFRCVGTDPGRGYLAWQPTLTEKPAFHVPERFGEFRFAA
jgi:hypothetical protein